MTKKAKSYDINDVMYPLGISLYVLQQNRTCKQKECPVCDGKGYIKVKGNKYDCPNSYCHKGKISYMYVDTYTVSGPQKTTSILIEKNAIKYCIKGVWYDQHNCFASFGAAMFEAEQRNLEIEHDAANKISK